MTSHTDGVRNRGSAGLAPPIADGHDGAVPLTDDVLRRGAHPSGTVVTAAPDHLLLAVWKRVEVLGAGVVVEGDERAVTEFFRGPLTA